ncbi:hypothetical protein HUT06_40080 [Actinomadura sp. NAK00032]|uniref:hypothetical protein n=1 Tax=Actinomadura sp. NAK00032 TaxID=2742128 RepID=UPI0015922676|nr:hypothetical protein [Actinomadura sp. NAK00032]QKW39471.1 hypothetical protein HUT06_40080 [Actinomadura sp. NAK00032]
MRGVHSSGLLRVVQVTLCGEPVARKRPGDTGTRRRISQRGRFPGAPRKDHSEPMEATIADDHIRFRRYSFRGATVHPAGVIEPSRIRDADWKAMRPEIRTTFGETLFLSWRQQSEMERFCARNGVTRRFRFDVWGDLLEPFLDTRFEPAQERATLVRLDGAGFSSREVAEIRRRLTPLMHAYNFDAMVWEWAYLGLFDLLNAANAPIVDRAVQEELGEPAAFYDWAMAIADRPHSSEHGIDGSGADAS